MGARRPPIRVIACYWTTTFQLAKDAGKMPAPQLKYTPCGAAFQAAQQTRCLRYKEPSPQPSPKGHKR